MTDLSFDDMARRKAEASLLRAAADGLEAALHLLCPPTTTTLECLSPAASLRRQADALEARDAKIGELVELANTLRKASRGA